MGEIRNYIIEKLGGSLKPTKEEKDAEYWKGYFHGRNDGMVDIIAKMESLYGDNAEDWSTQMYAFAKSQYGYWKGKCNQLTKEMNNGKTNM